MKIVLPLVFSAITMAMPIFAFALPESIKPLAELSGQELNIPVGSGFARKIEVSEPFVEFYIYDPSVSLLNDEQIEKVKDYLMFSLKSSLCGPAGMSDAISEGWGVRYHYQNENGKTMMTPFIVDNCEDSTQDMSKIADYLVQSMDAAMPVEAGPLRMTKVSREDDSIALTATLVQSIESMSDEQVGFFSEYLKLLPSIFIQDTCGNPSTRKIVASGISFTMLITNTDGTPIHQEQITACDSGL
jgi:hypothetical protein